MTPTVPIEVIGSRGTIQIDAVLDTGFDGALCLPVVIAVRLGFELVEQVRVEYADGRSERQLVFAGSVQFLDEIRDVSLLLTESGDALIGTKLLSGCTLFMDFTTGEIRIEKKEQVADVESS